ncbi:MAG: RNA polymerase sigma-70 factor [Filimonas sp.]|nr:RNA polymerase sigma-70 factor [Filimonas sp.]
MIRLLENARKKAFDKVYHETYGRLYSIFSHIVKDDALVKDILQQVFIKLWNKWDDIEDRSDLYPLLYTFAKNIFIDEIRKKQVRKDAERAAVQAEQLAQYADEEIHRKEYEARIQEIIEEMPERRKEVFLLSRAQGMSHKKIASVLSLSPNTVERHIQEAIKHFKKTLKTS